MEEIEKNSEKKKCADSTIVTMERNLNKLQEENLRLKSVFELSEREKKLLEKNIAKFNGK